MSKRYYSSALNSSGYKIKCLKICSVDEWPTFCWICHNNDQLQTFSTFPLNRQRILFTHSLQSIDAWDEHFFSTISITSMKRNRKQIELLLWQCHCLAFYCCAIRRARRLYLSKWFVFKCIPKWERDFVMRKRGELHNEEELQKKHPSTRSINE